MSKNHEAHKNHHSHDNTVVQKEERVFPLALSATLHCLLGCGLGEVLGMVIAVWLGLSMTTSMILAIILGFIFGLALGVIPLVRKQFTFRKALKTVVLAEGLSIVVMEAFEVGTQILIPGVMEAGLGEPVFWFGMLAALFVGFLAALPVNYILIRRGVRHQH